MGNAYTIQRAVAIYFGTTHTGYAHSMHEGAKVEINPPWTDQYERTHDRVPTDILLKNDGGGEYVLEDFGCDARDHYFLKRQRFQRTADEYLLFQKIKLQILGLKDPTNKRINSINGDELQAITAFSPALDYMRQSYMKQYGSDVSEHDIYWILTVPAQWEHNHKVFMGTCAVRANMLAGLVENNYAIVSESEAATYFCRQLKTDEFDQGDKEAARNHKSYDNFIVLDAGGGTVDISIVMKDSASEAEYHESSGGRYGGETVTDNFTERLKQIKYFKQFINDVESNEGDVEGKKVLLRFLANFEKAKRAFDGDKDIEVEVPRELESEFESRYNSSLEDVIINEKGFTFGRHGIIVHSNVMQQCYDAVLGDLEDFLANVLEGYKDTEFNLMYVVGGFGKNPYLRRRLCNLVENQKNMHILFPKDASNSVMIGAVHFAYSRRTTKHYDAKCTFAFGYPVSHSSKRHQGRPLLPVSGPKQILSLKPLVTKGSAIEQSTIITKTAMPYSKTEQDKLVIEIYISNEEKVEDPAKARVLFEFECKSEKMHTINIFFTAKEIRVLVSDKEKGLSTVKRITHEEFKRRYVKDGCVVQ